MGSRHPGGQPLHPRVPPLQRVICALLAVFVLTFHPGAARAQIVSDTEVADARAAILDPGTIIRLTDMDFGEIIVPLAPGTVVLTPSAAPTCNTSGGLIRSGNCQAASFAGDMSFLFLLRITKPPGGLIDLVGPGGATMRLESFSFGGTTGLLNMGSTPTEQRYLVTALDGSLSFHVGGTLRIAANQASGPYAGTFTLQFNYN